MRAPYGQGDGFVRHLGYTLGKPQAFLKEKIRMRKAILVTAVVLMMSGAALAQGQQQPPQSWDEAAMRSFNGVYNKLIAMAKDAKYPADKEGYKPHADSRSFLDELSHAAQPLVGNAVRMNGGDRAAIQAAVAAIPKDRAGIAATLEKAKADYLAAWEKTKPFGIIGLTEHAGEHYGKLVTIYRVNGLVPPGSRQGE